jgi:hypothetical protein
LNQNKADSGIPVRFKIIAGRSRPQKRLPAGLAFDPPRQMKILALASLFTAAAHPAIAWKITPDQSAGSNVPVKFLHSFEIGDRQGAG